MKKIYLIYAILCLGFRGVAQKTEILFSANSGLFSFAGVSPQSETMINYSAPTNSCYTNNPYGSKGGLSYGLSASLQHVSRHNFISGIQMGFEVLRGRIDIKSINSTAIDYTQNKYQAEGKTILSYNSINAYPYLGHRFQTKAVAYDFIGGIEFGHILKSQENGEAKDTNGTEYTTSRNRTTIKNDIRLRAQFSASYKKWGVYAGYSYGASNYMSGYVGGPTGAFSRILRFGLTYRIH